MKDVMGIIYTSKDEYSLRELSSKRTVTAIPLAARYRLVDFLLSNFVNSGVRKVGVLMQGNYHSLMDHLGSGKEWDLHTRSNGLYILPPFHNEDGSNTYKGILDALRANSDYLRRSSQSMVLIVGGNYVYNTVFDDMQKFHEDKDADITVMYTRFDPQTFEYSGSSHNDRTFVNVNKDGYVTDMEINPNVITYPNVLMDVILIKRTLLMHLTDNAVARGNHNLYSDVLRNEIENGGLKVAAYEYKGYVRRVETIKSYFNLNMDLLNKDVRAELFGKNPVYTKTRTDAPTRHLPGSKVTNSLVADGCVIEGEVDGCVLFRGVKVCKGAKLKNAIIMQDCYIGENTELENVILDKDVTILSECRLIGHKQYPVVMGKNVTL